MISVLCPSIKGREEWLARLQASLEQNCSIDYELIVCYDGGNWGEGINLAAEKAEGDHLFLASDDLAVWAGWDTAAVEVCDRGLLPAPLVLNGDGSLQSCGDWNVMQEEGESTRFSRFPFLSREHWDLLGPMLPPPGGKYPQSIHFSDVWLGDSAREFHGIETVIAQGYKLTHYMIDIGRRDYRTEEKLRREAEREIRRALAQAT